jgi:RNA polymerase subunit RPABC4/transcription elongation factor Spt4
MHYCLFCNKSTNNPKFCSRSCASSHNNKISPRRKLEGKCKNCQQIISATRTFCKLCINSDAYSQFRDWSKILLGPEKTNKWVQPYTRIRSVARNVYNKSAKPKQCLCCGYNKHYEVAHLKPISSFSQDTPISVINDLANLVALCRNCHWELDNGMLQL